MWIEQINVVVGILVIKLSEIYKLFNFNISDCVNMSVYDGTYEQKIHLFAAHIRFQRCCCPIEFFIAFELLTRCAKAQQAEFILIKIFNLNQSFQQLASNTPKSSVRIFPDGKTSIFRPSGGVGSISSDTGAKASNDDWLVWDSLLFYNNLFFEIFE